MRPCRFVVSRFPTIGFSLLLGLLASGQLAATPVFPDELSLDNGARLYEEYCSECHGAAPVVEPGASYASEDADSMSEYLELVARIEEKEAQQRAKEEREKEEEWPEWAERPAPTDAGVRESDVKSEIEDLVTAIFDRSQEAAAESESDSGPTGAGVFDPQPGATDLSDPRSFYYGTTEDEVFDSIANGRGAAMPGWSAELVSEESIWDLVNYIRSFWPESWLY